MTPYEVDRLIYGNKIAERIVVYDKDTGYYNPKYFDELINMPIPLAIDPSGIAGSLLYQKYFSKIEWILRDRCWSLF